jgi:hypothetical protein
MSTFMPRRKKAPAPSQGRALENLISPAFPILEYRSRGSQGNARPEFGETRRTDLYFRD